MTENIQWRVLREEEWPALTQFLQNQIGEDYVAPSPATNTVVAQVDEDGDILAVYFGSILIRFGPLVVASDVRPDMLGAVDTMKDLFYENGLTGSAIFSFDKDQQSHDALVECDFEPTGWDLYIGRVE